MTFYLKPPRGLLELDKMIECIQQRLEFITSIKELDSEAEFQVPQNITYFVENTAIDRASHYLLRLVSLKSSAFQSHVLQAETALFERRLHYLDDQHVIRLLKTCHQHSQEILNSGLNVNSKYSQFLISLSYLCQDLLRYPGGLQHVFGKEAEHSKSCRSKFVRVPYRLCLKLIAERKVELVQGEAHVPCGVWGALLSTVFHLHIQYGYNEMISSGCQNFAIQDSRISQLTNLMAFKFKEMMSHPSIVGHKTLTCGNLKEQSIFFPPCITSLLDTLQEHHRLGHHARIALTLFLKEAGMPVQQALLFWRSHYSVPGCKHGPSCSHSWQSDERKFTYSVRHLYGLEGGRKNYAAPCCSSIQDQLLAPNTVGGCPFKRLPDAKLIPLLDFDKFEAQVNCEAEKSEITPDVAKIPPEQQKLCLSLANSGKPSLACQQLLQARVKSTKQPRHNLKFSKPSHFYAICRDWSEEF